jgi:hypothetical protein
VKTTFNPSSVKVLAEFPKAGRRRSARAHADKVEVPQAQDRHGGGPEARPEPPPTPPVVQTRILFKAWSAAHDDLVAAYKDKKACKAKFDDVVDRSVCSRASSPATRRAAPDLPRLLRRIDEKTKTFTALPEKTSEKDIVDELDVAARVIRKEFNPDR